MTKVFFSKTLFLSIVVWCVATLSILIVHAQEGMSATQTPPEPRIEEVRETMQNRGEMRDARKATLTEAMQDRIINLIENVKNRLAAVVTRLEQISIRLESRIAKVRDTGIVTTEAEAELSKAKSSLEAARATLASLPSVPQTVRGETPRESFAVLRTELQQTRDLLRETHTHLTSTVVILTAAIRGGVSNIPPTSGTTTPTE